MTTKHEIEEPTSPSELQQIIQALEAGESKPGGRSVLVVDDEPSVRRMVSRSMKGLDPNLNIHQAENGQQALDLLAEIRQQQGVDPALIVTDLQMPVMDGWEFIDQLWKQCQDQGREFGIPLIVLSASTGDKGFLFGKSVHGSKRKYRPLVAIAKEDCLKAVKYDSQGEKGLVAWLKFFLRKRD